MDERNLLARRFEAARDHLHTVAWRILGSRTEAEDAVQDAWLRFANADAGTIDNVPGWLTTVVSRICLDMLRARKARREDATGPDTEAIPDVVDPERNAALEDSVGYAMHVVLETFSPPERVVFVLHDMFDVPFDQIATIIQRSPMATRQLGSRARRGVQGEPAEPAPNLAAQRTVIRAFLAASRDSNFAALLALLDPSITLHADEATITASIARAAAGAPTLAPEMRGPEAVANVFKGRAQAARPAVVGGNVGLIVGPHAKPVAVFEFIIEGVLIKEIAITADPEAIGDLGVTPLATSR